MEVVVDLQAKIGQIVNELKTVKNGLVEIDQQAIKTGKDIEKGFLDGSNGAKRLDAELKREVKTVADLELRLQRLKELLRDDTEIGTKGFQRVNTEIAKTQKQLDQANGKIQQQTALFKQQESQIASIGKQILAAYSIRQAGQFLLETIKIAAAAEGVRMGFERLNNPTLLDDLRAATQGTVDDISLMQQAVKANNFQIPLEQLGTLFEFARRRAKETGESVDYLVESIVTGIGRKSALVLDNLGISTSALKDELGGVSREAATIGQVTEAVSRIARKSLEEMGEEVVTTGDKIKQLTADAKNAQQLLGVELIDSISKLSDTYSGLGDSITSVSEAVGVNKDKVDSLSVTMKAIGIIIDVFLFQFRVMPFLYTKANEALTSMINSFDRGLSALKNFSNETIGTNFALTELERTIESLNQGIGDDFQNPMTDYVDALEKARQAATSNIETISILTGQIKELQTEQENANLATNRAAEIEKEIEAIKERIAIALGKETEAMKAARTEREKLTAEIEKSLKTLNALNEAESPVQADDEGLRNRALLDVIESRREALKTEETLLMESRDNQLRALDIYGKSSVELTQLEAEAKAAIWEDYNEKYAGLIDERIEGELEAEAEKREIDLQLAEEKLGQVAEYAVLYAGFLGQLATQQADWELQLLQQQLDAKKITQEQFEAQRRKILTKEAQDQKQLAIFETIITGAQAVISELNKRGPLAAAAAAIATTAQLALIASKPIPKFAKGTEMLEGGKGGKDDILLWADRGEAIIPANKNKKYKGLSKAFINDNIEGWLMTQGIKHFPMFGDMATQAQAASVIINNNFDDKRMLRQMKKGDQLYVDGTRFLAESIAKAMKGKKRN